MRIFVLILTLLFTNVSFGKIHGTSEPFCDGKENINHGRNQLISFAQVNGLLIVLKKAFL